MTPDERVKYVEGLIERYLDAIEEELDDRYALALWEESLSREKESLKSKWGIVDSPTKEGEK